ncbi:MAG: YdgA family protein [Gammaproteobacteria bacterium]|nr:YdgA family protein [Gammaproteobacteria bacterium]
MSTKRVSVLEVLLWLLSFMLVLVLLSPFGLGFKIQSDYSALIQQYSAATQLDLRVVKYDRGFYSSDVVIELKLPDLPQLLQLKQEVVHGPVYLGLINQGQSPFIAAVIKGELIVPAEFQVKVSELFANQKPLLYQELIDFSGNIKSTAYVPVINATLETVTGPLMIQSSGMTMNSYYSTATETVSIDVSLPVFTLKNESFSMNMQDLSMSLSGKMGLNDLLVGDNVISLRKYELDAEGSQFAFNNVRIRSVTSDQGGLIDSQAQINVREIFASNEKMGPITFNFALNGLNATSIKQLQSMQKTLDAKVQQGVPEEQINAMLLGEVMGILPDLFKQSELKINPLKIESELGKLETELSFSVEGLDASAPADPMFMLNAMNLDLVFSVDELLMRKLIEWELISNEQKLEAVAGQKTRQSEAAVPMAQKVNENLQGLIDEGLLVSGDGVYTSNIVLKQGQMLMNGRSVDPMQQIMSSMAPPAPAQ